MPGTAGAAGNPAEIVCDLADEAATLALGAALAAHLAAGDMVALRGDLGSGKTTFARGLLRQMGYRGDVPSPTFTLVQQYDVAPAPVWHFDLYRIADADELTELGWDDARAEGIVLVEWPERLGPLLPQTRLDIELSYRDGDGGDGRRARLVGSGAWRARLERLADGH